LAVGSLWLENPAPSAGGGEADLDRRRSPEAWKTTQTWRADGSVAAAVGAPSSPALAETCGNSLLDSGEECDDGNADSGDGCSELCLIEEGWTCTKPVPPATGTKLVKDPGFEAGTPNPVWAAASTNAGSPLCTINDCGFGGGTGPRTGNWWAWFGGVETGFEEGSVSQSVVITTTATTLTFALDQPLCNGAEDFLEVTVDGNLVFGTDGASVLCGAQGYSTQSANISAFADGAPHALEFHSQTFATNEGITNFFVDDVELSDNVPIPPVPSQCFPVVPLACNGPVIDFDTPAPGVPPDWEVLDNEGNGLVWTDITTAGESGNYTGGRDEAATVSSDAFGTAEFDTELRTAPFDLSAVPSGGAVSLDYLANYQNFLSLDFLDLDLSDNGGGTWTNLLRWNEDHGGFRELPGEAVSVDLSAWAGMSGLIVRWRYYDPGTDDFDFYAQIDNVALTCDVAGIEVSPSSVTSLQQADTQTLAGLAIGNGGTTSLSWSVTEAPSNCAAPADVPWLSASPTGGTTAGGAESPVEVTLDATGLAPGGYNAKLCVNSNDPVNPLAEVPVTMEVVGCVDNLALASATLTGGDFTAAISISGGSDLLIDGPVSFSSQEIRFVNGVEVRSGFSTELSSTPCP
jgi:cysteine-rich repeat protein